MIESLPVPPVRLSSPAPPLMLEPRPVSLVSVSPPAPPLMLSLRVAAHVTWLGLAGSAAHPGPAVTAARLSATTNVWPTPELLTVTASTALLPWTSSVPLVTLAVAASAVEAPSPSAARLITSAVPAMTGRIEVLLTRCSFRGG